MRKLFMFFLLLVPFATLAQYRISGRVLDSATKKPLANVNVFLSNASAGASTNNEGAFVMNNVRGGQYEMVISIIGYTTRKQMIFANKDIALPDIYISQQVIQLHEVRIGADTHWAEHYAIFKREFLGTTDNAAQCDILNPHALSFFKEDGVLSASADAMLIIENKALGYRIKYMLTTFTDDAKTGKVFFEGEAFFEDMTGSKHKIKKWAENRLNTYQGSDMHFLRSVIANQVKQQGFEVRRLIRKPNPDYKGGLNNKYIQSLVTTLLEVSEYAALTDQKGEYVLSFKDCLDVNYKPSALSGSIVTIDGPYAYFDNNGIILNPEVVTMEGKWGESRMAGMLPVDYEPPQK